MKDLEGITIYRGNREQDIIQGIKRGRPYTREQREQDNIKGTKRERLYTEGKKRERQYNCGQGTRDIEAKNL